MFKLLLLGTLPFLFACSSMPEQQSVAPFESYATGTGEAPGSISGPSAQEAAPAADLKDTFGAFLGGSSERDGNTGLTLGMNYEHRFTPQLGFGGFAELSSGGLRDLALAATGFFHPTDGLTLVAGPGVEYEHQDWHGLFRIGGNYTFPLQSGWMLGPAVYYDFTSRKDVLVYGITIGTSF